MFMKTRTFFTHTFLTLLLLMGVGSGSFIKAAQAPAGTTPATNKTAAVAAATTNAPVEIPKSVFKDDINAGKDPFFPKSERRKPQIVQPADGNAPPVASAKTQLKLKAISGKLVLINNATLAEGESAEVKISATERRKVKLLTKGKDWVELQVEGESEPVRLTLEGK
jgi:hypothetical protein